MVLSYFQSLLRASLHNINSLSQIKWTQNFSFKDHKITLNLGDGTLQTHQGSCNFFNKPHSTPKTMKIRAEKTTIIPPNTMQYMRGKIPQTGNNFQGLTEPYMNAMSNTGLLIANAMVYTKKRSLPVQCINATDESITIHKGKLLGFLQPLDSGDSVYNVTASEDHSLTQSQPSHPQENVQSTPKEKWTREELFHRLKIQDLQSKLSSTEMSSLKNLLCAIANALPLYTTISTLNNQG